MPNAHTSWWRVCVRGGCRWARWLFRAALCLLLLVQLLVLVGLWREDAFSLPDFAFNALQDAIAQKGLFLSAQTCKVTTSGWIVLSHPRLFSAAARTETVLEADEIAVQLSYPHLLLGRVEPQRLSVNEGMLRCPAYLSPGGDNEPLIDHLNLRISRRAGERWVLERGAFSLFNLTAEAAGDFFLPELAAAPADKAAAPAQPVPPVVALGKIAAAIQTSRPWLLQLDHPRIFVRLAALREQRRTRIEARAEIDGWSDGGRWSVGPAAVSGVFLLESRTPRMESQLSVSAQNVVFRTKDAPDTPAVTVGKVLLTAEPPAAVGAWPWGFIGNLRLRARDVAGFGASIDILDTIVLPHALPQITLDGRALVGAHAVDFGGSVNVAAATASLAITVDDDPRALVPEALIGDPGVRSVEFKQPPRCRLSAVFGPNWTFQKGEFSLQLFETRYQSVHLQGALAEGEVDTVGLRTRRLRLWGEDFALGGSFVQDFHRSTYRFLLRGLIPPPQLDALMEPWWQDIWKEFQLRGHFPYADIDFGGKWGTDIESTLVGEIRLHDFDFRGAAWQSGHVGLRLTPQCTHIKDIALQNSEGLLSGNFYWFYKTDIQPRLMFLQRLSIQSTLPLPLLGKVGGDDVEDITREFVSQNPPRLSGEFYTWGVGSSSPGDMWIDLSVAFDGPAKVFSVPVRNLSLHSAIDNNRVRLYGIESGLAGGQLAGALTLSSTALGTRADFDFDIKNADHARFLDDVSLMHPAQANAPAADAKAQTAFAPEPPDEPGSFFLKADGTGVFGHADTFNGKGALRIEGADIGRLNLLGGLSAFLEKTVLPSGQLHFNDAQSDFLLENGVMVFPRLAVTGPTCKLDAAGRYSLVNQAIDFRIHFYPFGGMRPGIIKTLSTAAHPFSNTFVIQLKGTSKDPAWELDFSPSQILKFTPATPTLPERSEAFEAQKPAETPKTLEKAAE